jgi:hypothetical protein
LWVGDNVILMGNHQSEGDAAFIPLMTEVSHPGLGEKVTYVAGDRVVTDLMAKPFSMGKNLFCVHSKVGPGRRQSSIDQSRTIDIYEEKSIGTCRRF